MLFRSRSVPALAGLLALIAGGLLAAQNLQTAAGDTPSTQPALPPSAGSGGFSIPLQSGAPAQVSTPVASATAATSGTTETEGVGDAYKPWVGKKFNHGPGGAAKMIALTFDDGPHPHNTPIVLHTLKEAGVTATFFWIGEMVQKNPTIAKQVQAAGFEFGSHTWSHKNLRAISAEADHKEMMDAQDEIQKVVGVRPHLFRPPYGNVNANVTKIAKDDNLAMVLWTVDSNDWKASTTPDKELETILHETHGGSVILVHDIQTKTVNLLPKLLTELKAKGFQFVTVSQLMAEANKHPEALSGGGGGGADEPSEPAAPLSIPLDQTK